MQESIIYLKQHITSSKLVASLLILFIIIVAKILITKFINTTKALELEQKRRWAVNSNSTLSFLFFVIITIIWISELQNLALSFIAFAVALVLAMKEVIACFTGGLYRAINNTFHLGDRIEINGIRGDVIDRKLMSTTILEIGPRQRTHQYTGRSVVLPNSLFLSNVVINESFLKNYVLHTFKIPLNIKADWEEAESIILNEANKRCEQFAERAGRYLDTVQKKAHLETPKVEPRVHMNIVDHNHMELIVRVTVPAPEKGQVEQDIIRGFMRRFTGWEKEED
jgi:small-conductance mechanosensitive channel